MSTYPPAMTLRPLDGWPTEFTRPRREAPFRATFTSTLQLLDQELRRLDPKDTRYPPSVLQIALRERDFRNDGMPRADAKTPAHPGVIVSIEPRNLPAMSFPCDTFTDWQDNLRAIALGLEALRKINRYGITQTGQQYRGWQAIEAKASEPPPTVRGALEILAAAADMPAPNTGEGAALAYRNARKAAHPDRNGGDQIHWDRVEAAGEALRAAGWLE